MSLKVAFNAFKLSLDVPSTQPSTSFQFPVTPKKMPDSVSRMYDSMVFSTPFPGPNVSKVFSASFWGYDSWISCRDPAMRPLPELPRLGSLRLREASQAKEGGHLMFNVTQTYDAMELT